jgi:hypothetical protein
MIRNSADQSESSEAQPFKVGIPGADLRFDCRNLLVAPFDSNRIL